MKLRLILEAFGIEQGKYWVAPNGVYYGPVFEHGEEYINFALEFPSASFYPLACEVDEMSDEEIDAVWNPELRHYVIVGSDSDEDPYAKHEKLKRDMLDSGFSRVNLGSELIAEVGYTAVQQAIAGLREFVKDNRITAGRIIVDISTQYNSTPMRSLEWPGTDALLDGARPAVSNYR